MIDTATLIMRADAYKALLDVPEDSTVSYRVFGDTKKLGALRNGADITVRRFNAALRWFDENWPTPCELEPAKPVLSSQTPEGAA